MAAETQDLHVLIKSDLALLVHPGLLDGYHQLTCLPDLPGVECRRRSLSVAGNREAVRRFVEDGISELRPITPQHAAACTELLVLGARATKAKDRRSRAGKIVGVGTGEGFRSHHEDLVLGSLSEVLVLLNDRAQAGAGNAVVDVGWLAIQSTLHTMHREIEQQFPPDIVVTMSGPGSFAAYLCLAMDTRDVPVVACTTFPRRQSESLSERLFADAALRTTWEVVRTEKWVVYLPGVLGGLQPGCRVLIFDDRVVSGHTQREVRTLLEASNCDVRTAAMIVSSESRSRVNFHGMVLDDDYAMPWGSRRGRT